MTESIHEIARISVGTTLAGRYELVELLGTGGFGSVYKARQVNLGSFVAVKLLNADVAPNMVALGRLQAEAKALAALDHSAIPKVYCVEALPSGGVFVVMDYIEGVSLDHLLCERGKLPADEAVAIFVQIADALGHAHSNGIIHRDLKPGNIMISGERAYVLDFGIAKNLDSAQKFTQTGAVLGTVRYMSPEQAQGIPVTARSDIYSLGCVLYETLAGKSLFESDAPFETMMRHVQETLPPFTSPEVSQLAGPLSKALAKDPSDRFESMADFSAALRAPDMVSVQKISKRSARKGRSRYVVVAAIAGALITAAGMYVFFDIQQRQAAAAYAIDEFLSSSYTGPIDDERLQTYAQDVARRKDSSEAVRAVGNLNSAIERRRSTLDSKATASLGQAAITVMRSTSQPNWDRIARIVRDAMLMRNRNDDTVMLAYLRKLADDEDQSGRGMEREALAIKHMAGQQLLNTGHAAEGMAMMKDVINADPDKQPYYYSVGQFLLVAKAGADKQPEAAITRTTSFINTYGKRDPYKQFLPCFYSLLGQQFNDLKQTRDMWWSGYASGVDYLDHPQLLHENDDVDAILLNTAAYDGVAAVSATIELAHDGRDSKKHAEQMLSDIESRPFCQSSDKCKVEFSQLRERLQALRVRGRGTNG